MQLYPIWKRTVILAIVGLGALFASPNMFKMGHDILRPLKLGLDLQGGSHLLLEIEQKTVLSAFYEGLADSVRSELRNDKIRYSKIQATPDAVVVTLRDASKGTQAVSATNRITHNLDIRNAGNKILYRLNDTGVRERMTQTIGQTIEIIRKRIDGSGTQEPLIQRQGDNRIVLQLPGVEDPSTIKQLLGKTAKMTFHLVDDTRDASDTVPPNLFVSKDDAGVQYVLQKRVYVSGESLVDAQPTYSDNQPVVSFRFDTVGARKFGSLTSRSVGKRIAIVLDGTVISAPNVNEPILGGSGIITGNFTVETAGDLALLLRSGALPVPLTIAEERTVGPGLGADSIVSGKMASILGLIFVIIFMNVIYPRFGLYATVALGINMILIVAVLGMLQATLTLPGIAGIVLTIGMAVDANVLIFERIREEIYKGSKVFDAVDRGFKFAFLTIVDANITGLIAGFILFAFGTGPIKGFAVTLSIGILTSMFCAILITRWLLLRWVVYKNPTTLPKGF